MNDLGKQAIDILYTDFTENYKRLVDIGEVSFANSYQSQFAKVILLASASYFESAITLAIHSMLNPAQCLITKTFIENKALTRQYHSLFDWNDRSANKFFAYFGHDFKAFMIAKLRQDAEIKGSIDNFLELGDLRNQLAHKNYIVFVLNLTPEEIYAKFLDAHSFIDNLSNYMNEFKQLLAENSE
jgi:hypothetical protein